LVLFERLVVLHNPVTNQQGNIMAEDQRSRDNLQRCLADAVARIRFEGKKDASGKIIGDKYKLDTQTGFKGNFKLGRCPKCKNECELCVQYENPLVKDMEDWIGEVEQVGVILHAEKTCAGNPTCDFMSHNGGFVLQVSRGLTIEEARKGYLLGMRKLRRFGEEEEEDSDGGAREEETEKVTVRASEEEAA